ncbi:serine hydrolase domain-containing protein [Aureimonas frigidaquae]|uniref:serine hydrolase domain-containing protein n=1 Tax=Aureimonas frigidaquae TaxID=424757 RepID=UPI0007836723|nr:serine hydrolase [Aureimonas frigidaquae]
MVRSRFGTLLCLCLSALMIAPAALAQDAVPSDVRETPPAPSGAVALGALGPAFSAMAPLRTVMIAQGGDTVLEAGFRGYRTDRAANIKSASKSVISALVGIAISKGILGGADQRIETILGASFPADPDPRLSQVTIGHLLSMQAGLERTSGANYGGWIASRDWVRDALARPFVDAPGGAMLYSTGSTHLLSAILTKASGKPTRQLAREWLAPAGAVVSGWERDPQGIDLGGNQTAMTPRALLAFGELYRRDGLSADGTRVIAADWIAASWTPRTRSRFTGEAYGYGWFLSRFAGHDGAYGWGYGGQMIYVIPSLELTVAITSDDSLPSGRSGYVGDLHRLIAEQVVPAAQAALAARARNEAVPASDG